MANNDDKERGFRRWIAFVTIALSMGAIIIFGVLGYVMILKTSYPKQPPGLKFGDFKVLLAILLPVLSAWAGTILAYYFTRENYESANKASSALFQQITSQQKLEATPVGKAMINMDSPDTDKLVLAADEPLSSIYLEERIILAYFEKVKNYEDQKERLPILDEGGIVKYIAHRSLVDRFIAKKAADAAATGGTQDVGKLTLEGMLKEPEFAEVMEGFEALDDSANLAAVKKLIDSSKICADVFITDDGTKNGKAKGWITDAIVRKWSEVQ